jgi:mono/diheme cytochrome c family protein
MPPFGGATLTDEQLRAVAAYVYSLSHPEVGQPAT